MGVVESRSDRSRRDAERVGDLREWQTDVMVERQQGALIRREATESAFQLVSVVDRELVLVRRRRLDGQYPDAGRPAASLGRFRVAGMDEDPADPGVKPIRIAEARQFTPGDLQRVLRRILGSIDVAEDSLREPIELVTAGTSQVGKCLPVTLLRPNHEVAIHSASSLDRHPVGCRFRE
jgi:hypothetical protein